jgi:L-glutamine-phosphate cytidylyltransferase
VTDIRQAVLLAAGTGTRLLPLTEQMPKCMVPVAGKPIVDHLLTALAPLALDELIVVTGYRADRLRAHLGSAQGPTRIRYVDNPDYATTNNIYSLYLARELVSPPFALLESDIVAGADVLAGLGRADQMIVARYTADMDGTGVRVDEDGKVREMIVRAHTAASVQVTELYKTVNFYSFSAATWNEAYRPALEAWVARGRLQDYYEAVLAELVNAGTITMNAVDVTTLRWTEIDDSDDLRRAEDVG